jgi:hypothetical protein
MIREVATPLQEQATNSLTLIFRQNKEDLEHCKNK